MSGRTFSGLFVAEGSSDAPLADIVEALFLDRDISLFLSKPDFELLGRVPKDVRARIMAGLELSGGQVDLVVIHRDADSAGWEARIAEIAKALESHRGQFEIVPVIPVRMTEAWLLLDEAAIPAGCWKPRRKNESQPTEGSGG